MRSSPKMHIKRRDAIILGVTGAILASAITAVTVIRSYQSVSFINGLDVPVTIEVDGTRLEVGKQDRAQRTLHEGVHDVKVLGPGGSVIEEGPVNIPGRCDLVVYNVLGAAPLFKEGIVYSSMPSSDGSKNQITFLGNARVASVEDAQYVFVEPPHTISVDSKSHEEVVRVAVDVAKGGWISTVGYLDQERKLSEAAALARAVAKAEPDQDVAVGAAYRLTSRAEGFAGMLRLERANRSRQPESARANLGYVQAMRRAGRADEARAEYKALLAAHPESVVFAQCVGRLSSKEEAGAIYEALWKAHPEDSGVRESIAAYWSDNGEHAKAVEVFAKMQGDSFYRFQVDDNARSLVALGRTPEAIALVSRFAAQEATQDVKLAILYARLARLPGAGTLPASPRAYLDQIARKPGADAVDAWASSLLGESVGAGDLAKIKDDGLRRAIEIQVAAVRDPREAQDKCAAAPAAALEQLDPVVATLLAAEIARAGNVALAARILAPREEFSFPPAEIIPYVLLGTEHPDLWRLDPEMRAALDLVRARQLDAEGAPSEALLEAVTRNDVFKGIATLARDAWPKLGSLRPDKAAKGAVVTGKGAPGAGKGAEAAPAPPSGMVVLRRETLL